MATTFAVRLRFTSSAARHVELLMCIMRMSAERAVNIRKAVRYRKHFGLPPNARRDRNHTLDTGGAGARHHRIELIGKIREIEMAMAVDQHWRSIARLVST